MNFVAVGINFRQTSVDLRERLSFRPDELAGALEQFAARSPESEFVLVSTCNRTELYAAGDSPEVCPDTLIDLLLEGAGGDGDGLRGQFYRKEQDEALVHLMTVASSLDSMVVGETEIFGQVKQAYRTALAADRAGRYLRPVFQSAFKVARRVRAETGISRGRVSIGSVAVDLAGKVFDDLNSKTVIVIGAGRVSEQTLEHLFEKGVAEAIVFNRCIEHGRSLADRYGGTAVAFEHLEKYLSRADIVISSTSAPHYVIRTQALRNALLRRRDRPIFLVDLAVPRDIEPGAANLANVYLHNIDDLQEVAQANLARRQDTLDAARAIIAEEATTAAVALRADGLGAVMRRLDEKAERIAAAEYRRAFAKRAVAPLDGTCERCRNEIRHMLRRALNKMTADTKKALNEAARDDRWDEIAGIMERLLGVSSEDGEDDGL